MVRTMRTDKKIGSRIKPKWGKIGAPHSAKRKAHLAKIRRKRRKKKGRKGKKEGLRVQRGVNAERECIFAYCRRCAG